MVSIDSFHVPAHPYQIAITGNRILQTCDYDIISLAMQDLMTSNIKAIYFGGAIGADTVALQACLDLVVLGRPQLIVVVPNRLQDQPKSTHNISKRADELIELKNVITVTDGYRAYHIRNEFLVNIANKVIAFYNGQFGGTAKTIEYAKSQNKHINIINIT